MGDTLQEREEGETKTMSNLPYYKCSTCGAMNQIINECGCDPNNLPTRPSDTDGVLIVPLNSEYGNTGFKVVRLPRQRNHERGGG